MLRWLLVIFVVIVAFADALPWLERFGLGRLPGDFRLTLFGRVFRFPFASAILLCLIIFTIGRLWR